MRLILTDGEHEEEVGGVRKTPRGYDAFARTFGYDPSRARRDIVNEDEARAFVEGFRPWELFRGGAGLRVENDVVSS
jgi:hypothetical protein